jgi:hypothetical protein
VRFAVVSLLADVVLFADVPLFAVVERLAAGFAAAVALDGRAAGFAVAVGAAADEVAGVVGDFGVFGVSAMSDPCGCLVLSSPGM